MVPAQDPGWPPHDATSRSQVADDASSAELSAYFMTSSEAGGYVQGGQYQGEAVPDGDVWRFRRYRILSGWGWGVDRSVVTVAHRRPAGRARLARGAPGHALMLRPRRQRPAQAVQRRAMARSATPVAMATSATRPACEALPPPVWGERRRRPDGARSASTAPVVVGPIEVGATDVGATLVGAIEVVVVGTDWQFSPHVMYGPAMSPAEWPGVMSMAFTSSWPQRISGITSWPVGCRPGSSR